MANGIVASRVASSADGNKLAAIGWDGSIYTSSDAGTTWKANTIANVNFWNSIGSSADGTVLIASTDYGPVYVSTDSGTNWVLSLALTRNWGPVASSADGSKLFACVENNGGIYRWQAVPVLSIGVEDGVSVLSWPATSSAADFTLEQTSQLDSVGWNAVTNSPIPLKQSMKVNISPTNGQSFFRMSRF